MIMLKKVYFEPLLWNSYISFVYVTYKFMRSLFNV